ncbi:MAG: arginine--tRNA ligase [Pseudomonadota bacterium]
MPADTPLELRAHLAELLRQAIAKAGLNAGDLAPELHRPRHAHLGDYATSLALQLAKPLGRNPRELAALLIQEIPPSSYVERIEVAGGGFINFFLKLSAKQRIVSRVLSLGAEYGRSRLGAGTRVQVEFVSANPTGPLHVGHGRGAAYGASVANLLQAVGFEVSREYYVNDAGRQMDILALSTWLRYLELCGVELPFPDNAYRGDYVRAMARRLFEIHGTQFAAGGEALYEGAPPAGDDPEQRLDALIANAKRLLGPDYDRIHGFALAEQLNDIRNDLQEFGVEYDCWFSERSLLESGGLERALKLLDSRGLLYRRDGALWFPATRFGDEKDRVVQRENGQYTYFASDIAYHLDKFERGFQRVIDVWGADHHGYVPRVKGALQALGLDPHWLHIALVQFAVLYRGGQKVSMSTRAGEFVTLRELRREVGNDAARFFYVLRKSDQHLDFDLDLAKSESAENPVYYVQYAHARVSSVLAQWGGDPGVLPGVDPSPLTLPQEAALLARLMDYPAVVESAAADLAPHALAFFLRDLAGEFHSYYNATPFLVPEEPVKLARLALVTSVRQVIRNGLALLGVSAPDKM